MVQHAHILDEQAPVSHDAREKTVSSERRFWTTIGAFGLIGALVPLFVFGLPDRGYVATTSLKVEAASSADVEAAIARLRSKASLDNLVRALNLSQAGDFSASRPSVFGVFSDIISGGGMTVSEQETELRNRLLEAIHLSYASGQLSIQAQASSNDEARRVAAMLAVMFGQQLAGVAETAANPALTGMRQAVERAEAALSGFETQAGTEKLAEMRRFSTDAERLGSEKDQAETELQATREKAAEAALMKFADVLSKPLPDSLEFTALEYQRQRYVDAKLTLDQLSSDLGPRHPRFQAAQAAVDVVRKDIEDALKRLSTSLRQQEATAAKTFSEAKARADALTAQQDLADGATKLLSLQAAAEEARENYLQAQGRTRAQPAASGSIQVLRPLATVATGWSWFDYLPLVAGGAFAGGLVGLAVNAASLGRREEEAEWQDEAVEQIEPHLADEQVVAHGVEEQTDTDEWDDAAAFDIEPAAITDYQARAYYPKTNEADDDEMEDYDLQADYDRDDDRAVYAFAANDHRTERGQAELADAWDRDEWQANDWEDRSPDYADRYENQLDDKFEQDTDVHDPEEEEKPLSDRIREILIANRRPVDTSFLPPLLAAALAGDGRVEQRAANDGYAPDGSAEEFQELRREMAELRERVQLYSDRRTASR
ncbi:uncharacterized protein involved in exopolysaccharide biosynthesis [Neorhizobium alkalisoli]|uniref:Uncharacterized protein involved in exopolysaccharide biosynthesis n=1 Tax=Neorhizobium alkalisoli TaxID=528178 RepID=A0A561QSK8_9HYPH|nr:uncharacterized protein involved in exopolysaccharide biosynthesis [Neorhizobium alkalisoli]